jgi:hypothetical protein
MKMKFDLFYCSNGKSPIGNISLDNDKAFIFFPEDKDEEYRRGYPYEDFDEYSCKQLPHVLYEEYFEGEEKTKKSYKKRKFNYSFTFQGDLDVDGCGYSRSLSGCAYLNRFQRLRLKYFYGKGWWQQGANINLLIQSVISPIIVSLATTLITLFLLKN